MLEKLSKRSPQVFQNILALDQDEEDDSESSRLSAMGTQNHKSIYLWSQVKAHEVLEDTGIPARISSLRNLHPFLQKLRRAYDLDYGKPSVVEPGFIPIKWFRKMSFVFKQVCHDASLRSA